MGANNIGVGWTPERDKVLCAAWAAGDTATKIAADMGGFEHTIDGGRNSVISRVHRLGLATRQTGKPRLSVEERVRREKERYRVRNAKRSAQRQGVEYVAPPVVTLVPPPEPAYVPEGIPFTDLRDLKSAEPNQCRYIDLKDMGPNFLYCGSETLPGESLCGHCKGISYRKPEQRHAMTQRKAA
ncbi:GcrA family cell cycle regulator [Tardiphaga sp. 37S4]|uniref:GcrA family cell cycle regulator n=1 Tax=Tardiphaga sp. 37S4 TaxID=1404741 RepID=UPI001E52F130|nr:GcrA family cell cycle regulator [Tardiphaga sp. 37S4]UFS77194.1 GcrA family cell cycle regulator [Tardiphaga sp. 37S4]